MTGSPADSAARSLLAEWALLRAAAEAALARLPLPHPKSEDFTYLRTGEFAPFLAAPEPQGGPRNDGRPKDESRKNGLPEEGPNEIPASLREAAERGILPACRDNRLVLVDGRPVPTLSRLGPEWVRVEEEGLGSDEQKKDEAAAPSAPSSSDLFLSSEDDRAAALAFARAESPLLLLLPRNRKASCPLQILFLESGANTPGGRRDAALFLRFESGAEAEVVLSFAGGDGAPEAAGLSNQALALRVGENAKARLTVLQADEGAWHFHFTKLRASLERYGHLDISTAALGCRAARLSYEVLLAGEGAEAEIRGAALALDRAQAHHFIRVHHLVPRARSRQHFKLVTGGRSRVSVDGTIAVSRGAAGTDAGQLLNSLLLSEEARADVKPRLRIFNDDVKCAHGATSGKLDAAQRFYLESRGLPAEEAQNLLTIAFLGELLEKEPDPQIRRLLEGLFFGRLRQELRALQTLSPAAPSLP